jgi:oligopeptide/dipeptide ABC transporter ATP-binding protein
MPPLLEIHNLVTTFNTIDGLVHAVNGVSFTLEQGETLAIVGESGSGKSVSMMSLLGLIPTPPGKVEQGEAIFHGPGGPRDLLHLSPAQMRDVRGGQIGFVFQDPGSTLNPVLTVGDQICESLTRHLGLSRGAARQRALELLAEVGIPDPALRINNYPFQLSGGMRQRVIIAIAIACHPQLIIADEPTTALDVTVQAQIVDLFKKLRQELGAAVIWITHDLGVVAGIAHRVMVLYGGRVVEVAQVDEIYERPLHPYTLGLLGALPRLDTHEQRRLVSIEGAPPDSLLPLRNCPFAWRCTHTFERCWESIPEPVEISPTHQAACFFDVEKGEPR